MIAYDSRSLFPTSSSHSPPSVPPAQDMAVHPPPPPHRRGAPVENKSSIMLTREENEHVFHLLGKRCFTLATAVVQLLTSEPPNHSKWTKYMTGVACFVRDNARRSYFIRVFDIGGDGDCMWQQELYTTFEYKASRPYFHTFEADHCMAGLSFANETEANKFRDAVEEKLRMRAQKKNDRRRHGPNGSSAPQHPGSCISLPGGPGSRSGSQSHSQLSLNNNYSDNNRRGSRRKQQERVRLTKNDIGLPSNFRHVQHVGWNPDTGFDANNVTPEFREFLDSAGVSEQQLADEGTRDFIYQFLSTHGGVEQAIQSIHSSKPQTQSHAPPAAPPVPPVPPYRHYASRAPPPPPHSYPASSRSNTGPTSAPPAPPPPPPPPPAAFPAAKSPSSAPPPPPPPPPLGWDAPAPRAPVNGSDAAGRSNNQSELSQSNNNNNMRNALMEQIRSGAKLTHVDSENESLKSSNSSNGGGAGGRDALLTQIRSGVHLKPIEAGRKCSAAPVDAGGLAGALQRALKERSMMLNQTDDSTDEDDDADGDEDEWDD